MKNKLQHLIEWLFYNEHSIKDIPALNTSKKLFWLNWIQWHLHFYLPGTNFILLFSKHQPLATFHIAYTNTPPKSRFNSLSLKHFEITTGPTDPSPSRMTAFQEYLILDIEKRPSSHQMIVQQEFVQIEFRNLVAFSLMSMSPYVIDAIRARPNLKPFFSAHPILVRLTNTMIQDGQALVKLIEYDHYIQTCNQNNRPFPH